MPDDDYLLILTARLADGIERLPAECRNRQREFLQKAQNPDGGFSGREGGSDLYYTGFAMRSLTLLGGLTPEITGRGAAFLRGELTRSASVIDFFSLLYASLLVQAVGGPDVLGDSPADWRERVAAALEAFRAPDHGYGKSAGAAAGSTYHTFLVALCYQLMSQSLPRPEEIIGFVRSRRREDGGFVEVAPMRHSGTNPTAAAVGVLQMIGDGLIPEEADGVIRFLTGMTSTEGGLRANGRAPLADLLSTFTGVWTLHQLGGLDRIDAPAVHRWTQSLELPGGGFRGGLWDESTDVEYTFYGLGILALVS
jgi:geranylgeranyl transferase type-2 subunit beta